MKFGSGEIKHDTMAHEYSILLGYFNEIVNMYANSVLMQINVITYTFNKADKLICSVLFG